MQLQITERRRAIEQKLKTALIAQLILCIAFMPIVSFAHPGGTDANGGHYNRSTGEYHYHHGYPAHQHENGECPYDFDDKTGESSGSSSSSSGGESQDKSSDNAVRPAEKTSTDSALSVIMEILLIFVGPYIFFLIFSFIVYIIILGWRLIKRKFLEKMQKTKENKSVIMPTQNQYDQKNNSLTPIKKSKEENAYKFQGSSPIGHPYNKASKLKKEYNYGIQYAKPIGPSPCREKMIYVYVTKNGTKYHTKQCALLKGRGNQIALSSAKNRGYTPCSRCRPPQ